MFWWKPVKISYGFDMFFIGNFYQTSHFTHKPIGDPFKSLLVYDQKRVLSNFRLIFHMGLKINMKFILSYDLCLPPPYKVPPPTRFGNPAKSPKMCENTRKHTKNTWFLHPKAIMSEIKCGKRAKKMNFRFVGKISQKDHQKSLIFHQFSLFFIKNGSFWDPPTDQRQ